MRVVAITDVVVPCVIIDDTPFRFRNPQPFPIEAKTANFTDFGDRDILAKLGVFSLDRARP